MSKAKTIASVIDKENKDQWIEGAQTLSKEKLEREVAAANPSLHKPEKAKATGPNRIRIEFEVTYEEAEILKRARELMSQKKNKNAQIGETVVESLRAWVDRQDPVRKAKRAEERKERKQKREINERRDVSLKQDRQATGPNGGNLKQDPQATRPNGKNHKQDPQTTGPNGKNHKQDPQKTWPNREDDNIAKHHRSRDRSAIPTTILHQVHLRDRGACRKRMPDGSHCGCRKWTEIHHIIPRAFGGEDTVENLITLCKSHHRQLHERSA